MLQDGFDLTSFVASSFAGAGFVDGLIVIVAVVVVVIVAWIVVVFIVWIVVVVSCNVVVFSCCWHWQVFLTPIGGKKDLQTVSCQWCCVVVLPCPPDRDGGEMGLLTVSWQTCCCRVV